MCRKVLRLFYLYRIYVCVIGVFVCVFNLTSGKKICIVWNWNLHYFLTLAVEEVKIISFSLFCPFLMSFHLTTTTSIDAELAVATLKNEKFSE